MNYADPKPEDIAIPTEYITVKESPMNQEEIEDSEEGSSDDGEGGDEQMNG